MLETLNELNGSVPFGRFHFAPEDGIIGLQYHLLGDHLEGEEMMNALSVIASMADEFDDKLRETIGSGVRALDAWNKAKSEANEPQGTGPVVDA